jgi:hypothetical protein
LPVATIVLGSSDHPPRKFLAKKSRCKPQRLFS